MPGPGRPAVPLIAELLVPAMQKMAAVFLLFASVIDPERTMPLLTKHCAGANEQVSAGSQNEQFTP